MAISFRNPDTGYTSCEKMNTLSRTSGEKLLSNLTSNINSLKVNWKGSDAKVHIDNIISLYDNLGSLLTFSNKVSATAGNEIVRLQEVRRSNGGNGQIGSRLSDKGPEINIIAKVEETLEYHCDVNLAKNDYSLLEQIKNDFTSFVTQFTEIKNELMNNWIDGMNRAEAVKCFDDFANNSETYKKYITDALENLNIAISNINGLY